MTRIAVLLSTYNGMRFLDAQLASVRAQTHPDVVLHIRDDGSTDGTAEKLGVPAGPNLGVFRSFMHLLETAPEAHAYAFCDQDDVWEADKLERAAAALGAVPSDIPAIWYTRLRFTDEHLNPTGLSPIPTESGFHTALVQNQATGCTVVLNAAARRLVLESVPETALMHDWWCYLVVSAFGLALYDPIPSVLYRKHGTNVTPAAPNWAAELYHRTRRFLTEKRVPERVTDQAREFRNRYGHRLDPDKRAILDGFLDARGRGVLGRLRYACTMPVRRNTPLDTFLMRMLIVMGRF